VKLEGRGNERGVKRGVSCGRTGKEWPKEEVLSTRQNLLLRKELSRSWGEGKDMCGTGHLEMNCIPKRKKGDTVADFSGVES